MRKRVEIILPGESAPPARGAKTYFEEERFAEELGRHLGFSVPLVADAEQAVSPDALILLFSSEPSEWMCALEAPRRREVLRRVCILQGQRAPQLLTDLETHRLAGGLESRLYHQWLARSEKIKGYGLVGLRSVVARLGGECANPPFASENYCVFNNPRASGLLDSLARYVLELDLDRDL